MRKCSLKVMLMFYYCRMLLFSYFTPIKMSYWKWCARPKIFFMGHEKRNIMMLKCTYSLSLSHHISIHKVSMTPFICFWIAFIRLFSRSVGMCECIFEKANWMKWIVEMRMLYYILNIWSIWKIQPTIIRCNCSEFSEWMWRLECLCDESRYHPESLPSERWFYQFQSNSIRLKVVQLHGRKMQ